MDRDARAAVRARLEWLRLMGVDHLPRTTPPRGAGAVSSGRPEATGHDPSSAPMEVLQHALFGESVPPLPMTAADRSRSAAAAPLPSPLAAFQAPEASGSEEALRLIREDLGDCRRCRLSEKRTNLVFGVGNPRAQLMFIGEGPGADEDARGEPFVGRAGQLLNKIIESMGLTREQVYIANVVKCRPPENRAPLPDETATCSPFLFRQVLSIRPRVIVCLGTPAAQTMLGTRETITRLRGSFRDLDGIKVMPTFHPAYLLRNPAAKRGVWEDMKQVMAFLSA